MNDSAPVGEAEQLSPVHFIGIGGAGMSGIARIMLAMGLEVSGSDAKESLLLTALAAEGARVQVGHDPRHVEQARTVVASSAVRPSNPELARARELGLRVLHRSEALAAVSGGHRVIAVAGTNGKTTTTAMLTVMLQKCGRDPSFSIGGELTESGTNAHLGSGEVFVLEADESDGTFVVYRPHLAVVTNVQPDHLDFYGTAEAVEAGFAEFARSIRPDGLLVACADDPGSARLAEQAAAEGIRVRTFGFSEEADVRLLDLEPDEAGSSFEVWDGDLPIGRARVSVPGRHNALNALAAWTALVEVDVPPTAALEAMAAFTGTRRRFEPRGSSGGVRLFDDYAHNPGKVAAALTTARQVAGKGRVVAVFQPHLYSRTRDFAQEFGQALGQADEVVVMDVYAAREDPLPGVSGALVADAVPLPSERVAYVPSWSAVAGAVRARVKPGDLVVTIGAGDITMLADEVLALLGGSDPR
ncbi:UDP-N-acetylmuramate--L-alanine ligase [Angustibacter sp. McL0619]|uniref:UDP-N-acetylmuramate--L-alanine ligase n=1 Tax=Angustibacter sp. McL0619 TaxID=3415676 RepID=UPI003CE72519